MGYGVMSFGDAGGCFQRRNELEPTVVAGCALVEYREPLQAKQRPRCTGGSRAESVGPVFLRFWYSSGQSLAIVLGHATGRWVTGGQSSRPGGVQTDRCQECVPKPGCLEVDQAGLGGGLGHEVPEGVDMTLTFVRTKQADATR